MNHRLALPSQLPLHAARAKEEIAPTPGLDDAEQLERAVLRGLVNQLQSRERRCAEWSTKALIEAHGGRIWVNSASAVTTQFHFSLPLASSP
jgi:sensor histidine kinase regulating citrate/malate metabolism